MKGSASSQGGIILFFDGACGLCDRAVAWTWDRTNEDVRFAPLQGETAKRTLPSELRQPPYQSLVVFDGVQAFTEAEGLRLLGKELPAPWRPMLRVLTGWPLRSLTRVVYRCVAQNRHRWFSMQCRVPDQAERLLP